jgi:hypothetical protein
VFYGAVVGGLQSLASDEASFRNRNYGGAFTTGYLVLFTDGGDTSGLKTQAQALAAEATSPDQVLAVGLQTPDYDAAALAALAPNAVISPQIAGNLTNAFGALGNRIAGQVQRTYLLGYCTPKVTGTHTVAVTVDSGRNKVNAS